MIYINNVSSGALTKSSIKSAPLMHQAIDLQDLPLIIKRIPGKLNAGDAPTHPPFITPDPHLAVLKEDVSPLHGKPNWSAMCKLSDAVDASALTTSIDIDVSTGADSTITVDVLPLCVAILVPLVCPDGLLPMLLLPKTLTLVLL
jgi:hypothetical protein